MSPHSRILLLASLAALVAGGCATSPPYAGDVHAGDSELASRARDEYGTLTESLFREDQALLGNEELKTILGSPVVLPDRAKLAVVRFGRLPYWWGWSEEFVRMNEAIDANFLGRLRTSGRLRDVAYMPALVAPPQMTIPHIRQAAGRLQADLVLIYRTSTYNYERHRWFKAPRTKAYCTVEAVLLDTRTGVIPFSTVVNERFAASESKKDYGFNETIARAEQQAIGRAWERLAQESVAFLDKPQDGATAAGR
jgi:hypothetical protein